MKELGVYFYRLAEKRPRFLVLRSGEVLLGAETGNTPCVSAAPLDFTRVRRLARGPFGGAGYDAPVRFVGTANGAGDAGGEPRSGHGNGTADRGRTVDRGRDAGDETVN